MAGDGAGTGVHHGALLIEFAEVMLGADANRQARVREAVQNTLGAAALADAAAVVASFNAVVKIADATGIPLEDFKAEATRALRQELDLDQLRNAKHHPVASDAAHDAKLA